MISFLDLPTFPFFHFQISCCELKLLFMNEDGSKPYYYY